MQRRVTLLNKSNKFVTVKWLAQIAFHVGQCSSICLFVWCLTAHQHKKAISAKNKESVQIKLAKKSKDSEQKC